MAFERSANRLVVFWLATGALLIYIMVVIGGITRLTGSGLSMVEWNLIMGSFPPASQENWMELFEKYKQFPQYEVQDSGFGLNEFKSIFWWEYVHRLVGRLIGLVFLVPYIYFLVRKIIAGSFALKTSVLFFLGGLQGFLGWYMVKSGLISNPAVSHFRLAVHLVTALITFGYTFWLLLDRLNPKRMENSFPRIRNFSVLIMVILGFQIIYGAFTAGLHAGYFYNTFPKMGDVWFPEGLTAVKPLYLNFLEGIAGVQFVHRYTGILIWVLEIVLLIAAARSNCNRGLMVAIRVGFIIATAQIILGIFTLIFNVPMVLALLHQTGAFALVAIGIYTIRRCAFTSISGSG